MLDEHYRAEARRRRGFPTSDAEWAARFHRNAEKQREALASEEKERKKEAQSSPGIDYARVLEQVEEPQAAVLPRIGSVSASNPGRDENERQALWAAAAMTQTREQLKEKFRQRALQTLVLTQNELSALPPEADSGARLGVRAEVSPGPTR